MVSAFVILQMVTIFNKGEEMKGRGGGHRGGGWRGHFREMGLRFTEPRRAIMEVLSQTRDHLSAEDIYLAVHRHYPAIGLTTVYRTLELLVEMGLVYKLQFGDGRARFEMVHNPHKTAHHHHLICLRCKKVLDYDEFVPEELELLRNVEKRLAEKFQFKILNHRLEFYGLCPDCQKELNINKINKQGG